MFKQSLAYHNFADQRNLCCVPNSFDVLSNFPFILFGGWGLSTAAFASAPTEWLLFFIGCILTGIGSSYYHWNPNNDTLFWDRLPMTISFMSFFSILVTEQTDWLVASYPTLLLTCMVGFGCWSVLYWRWHDNLLPYVLVQFGPMVMAPYLLTLRDNPRMAVYVWALGWYMVAKICETFDRPIFQLTGYRVSGHTLKHLTASLGMYVLIQ